MLTTVVSSDTIRHLRESTGEHRRAQESTGEATGERNVKANEKEKERRKKTITGVSSNIKKIYKKYI